MLFLRYLIYVLQSSRLKNVLCMYDMSYKLYKTSLKVYTCSKVNLKLYKISLLRIEYEMDCHHKDIHDHYTGLVYFCRNLTKIQILFDAWRNTMNYIYIFYKETSTRILCSAWRPPTVPQYIQIPRCKFNITFVFSSKFISRQWMKIQDR